MPSSRALQRVVIPTRFERVTHSLEGCCSIQLSYGTIFVKTGQRYKLYLKWCKLSHFCKWFMGWAAGLFLVISIWVGLLVWLKVNGHRLKTSTNSPLTKPVAQPINL